MGQRKLDSLLESTVNSFVSVLMYVAVVGVMAFVTDSIYATLWAVFVVSIGKNYVVRRVASRRERV